MVFYIVLPYLSKLLKVENLSFVIHSDVQVLQLAKTMQTNNVEQIFTCTIECEGEGICSLSFSLFRDPSHPLPLSSSVVLT
jgi:hypothetical protein